ncbi:Diaminopimelate decarboxylase [Rubripirellula reticaptiva]|uniref:Diaminopimelate decarboxylase n=2 Tax=Rubripirellula reticaptiva TaxID=2528013 RepID=A0A5C6EEH5_9BACT|nr:Diaminopimelate decarboxylase [Rubripirellula reticaptiva]
MIRELSDAESLGKRLDVHGSPLHLHAPAQMRRNIAAFTDVAKTRNIAMDMFYACKANKCRMYLDEAIAAGIGVDVASSNELNAAIEAGFSGSRIAITATSKPEMMLRRAAEVGATIIAGSPEELRRVADFASRASAESLNITIRISGFAFSNQRHDSRFGIDISQVMFAAKTVRVSGLHFHLDGTSIEDRVAAIHQTILLAKSLRQAGHPIAYIDIGGGAPVQYLESESDWIAFHHKLDIQLDRQWCDDEIKPIIFPNRTYGRTKMGRNFVQTDRNYPTWQADSSSVWLAKIFDSGGIADSFRSNGLRLRMQPGRSLLEMCGITVARVISCSPDKAGDTFVTLEMNQTNCKTTSVDFAVDPILVPHDKNNRPPATTGYLAGNYCAEDDLITPRRMRFDRGVQAGDILAFPNTAGYQMHFMESRGHQFDLPENIAIRPTSDELG